jgi:hypothetical protein
LACAGFAAALAAGGLFAGAAAAFAEVIPPACADPADPAVAVCVDLDGDTAVVQDFTLTEELAVPEGTDLVVEPAATLTLADGAAITGADKLINHGTIVVTASDDSELTLTAQLVNYGQFTIATGAALIVDGAGAHNDHMILNQGTLVFLPDQHPSDDTDQDALINSGVVDNTAGHVYLTYAHVDGPGTWEGTGEHAPLFSITLTTDLGWTAELGWSHNWAEPCLPSIEEAADFGDWALTESDDYMLIMFLYEGLDLHVTMLATCLDSSGTLHQFEGWGLRGDGLFPMPVHGNNPFTIRTGSSSLAVSAGYAAADQSSPTPTPTPSGSASTTTPPASSASPTLAPTGLDLTESMPEAALAAVLTALGVALIALAAALTRRHHHQRL